MKTVVSLPDPVFEAADELAARLEMSRSQLYAAAIDAYLRSRRDDGVTEALNRIYEKEPSELAPDLARLQSASLPVSDFSK